MKHLALPLLAALALLAGQTASAAPEGAASAAAAASAPRARPRVKLPPRRLSPAEQRQVDTPPLDEPPQGRVQPQISIPLGKKKALPVERQSGPRATGAAASAPGRIDDAAARCNAEPDAQARARCREQALHDH